MQDSAAFLASQVEADGSMAKRYRTMMGVVLVAAGAAACHSSSSSSLPGLPVSPTAPTPSPAPGVSQPQSVNGVVMDTAYRPVRGALVEILTGVSAGASTMTDARGEFAFPGSIDTGTTLRASGIGHV